MFFVTVLVYQPPEVPIYFTQASSCKTSLLLLRDEAARRQRDAASD